MAKGMKKGLKLLFGLFASFLFGGFLSGCTLSASDVKLHTKEEMQDIVDKRYGEAELIDMEENEEVHKRVFTYRDKKYGFTYTVVSRPNSVGMDGSTFYYDGASIMFNYEEPFLDYFKKTEEEVLSKKGIELCDSLDFDMPADSVRKFSLKSKMLFSTSDKWENDMKYVWDLVQKYHVPELTQNYDLKVYDSDKSKYVGKLSKDGFVTAEQLEIEYYMYEAQQLGGIQGIEYVRTEKKKISEIPELADQEFYELGAKERDMKVKVFYFTYEGKEYFIIDQWVAQIQDNEGGGGIFQYYQNYKHYDVDSR